MSTNEHIENWNELTSSFESSTIKHYSFDFWNTIAYSNPIFKQKRAEYFRSALNQNYTLQEINNAFEKIGRAFNILLETGAITTAPGVLYQQILNELKYYHFIDINRLLEDIESIFLQHPPIISEEFTNYYNSISSIGNTFSITSNTAFISGEIIRKYLRQKDLIDNFQFCLFSDEVGYGKPSSQIFGQLFLKAKSYHTNLLSDQIIHIGDNKVTDYMGAKKFGFEAFHITTQYSYTLPRYSVHSIKDMDILPFSSEEYSRFKFGDFSIAEKYGIELFEYFKTFHLRKFDEIPSSIIVYSSPYSTIPTSSYYMTQVFVKSLENFIQSKYNQNIKLKFGKIKRCQTYTEDYGAMTAIQRYDLIKNDTYIFADVPDTKSLCVFIDDVSITGSHQFVIENMMTKNKHTNKSIFLYYAKLDNSKIPASFENVINFAYVNSIDKLLNIIISENFKITTRTIKFILSMSDLDLDYLIKTLVSKNQSDLLINIHKVAIENGYNDIDLYKNNLNILNFQIVS